MTGIAKTDLPKGGGAAEWKASGVPFCTVRFGSQKINFHGPALWQQPGFTLRGPAAGPVELRGPRGRGSSTYLRDPEGNLLESFVYPTP